jgi:hypothetical protein
MTIHRLYGELAASLVRATTACWAPDAVTFPVARRISCRLPSENRRSKNHDTVTIEPHLPADLPTLLS